MSLFANIFPKITFNFSFPTDNSSIGIIGGADGPTSIFVAGRLLGIFAIPIIWIGLSALITFLVVRHNNKKYKDQ